MQIQGLHAQVARSTQLISRKLGIVRDFRRGHNQTFDPRIVSYSATTCDPRAFSDDALVHQAGGAGLTWMPAFLATVGEAVERYGSGFYRREALVRATARDLRAAGHVIAGPEDFALFHASQYEREGFPFTPFTDELEIHWERMRDLASGEDVLCPAVFVYMPFRADPVMISEQISTGFAAHGDPVRAALGGIFEVVERDAFMIAWMNELPLPKLRLSGALGRMAADTIPSHFDLHLLDMTTDIGLPSVVGLMRGEHDFGPFIAVCAATRFTLMEAARKTVIELCQSIPYYRSLVDDDRRFERFEDVRTFADHGIFYIKRPDLMGMFDPWLKAQASVDAPEVAEPDPVRQLGGVVRRFARQGRRILVRDKTTPDLKAAGFSLQRVVIPGLIHLNGDYAAYYLGGRRLYEAPAIMGHKVARTFETLNRLPHPFP
jgi:ribosomal protein S12 methylthiotransferase accessory factor